MVDWTTHHDLGWEVTNVLFVFEMELPCELHVARDDDDEDCDERKGGAPEQYAKHSGPPERHLN